MRLIHTRVEYGHGLAASGIAVKRAVNAADQGNALGQQRRHGDILLDKIYLRRCDKRLQVCLIHLQGHEGNEIIALGRRGPFHRDPGEDGILKLADS